LDARILNATTLECTGRDEAGWIFKIDGIEVRAGSIGELAQCQRLADITFSFLWGNPLTADELFSLWNIKTLKKLTLGRFSASLTPNSVEIFFRARPDLTISAVCSDRRKLIWDSKYKPNAMGQYSCFLEGSMRI
jgi:hypothetical protein